MMEEIKDQWLWVVDEELVQSLVREDRVEAKEPKRTLQSAALARALSLNTEGKTEAALREVRKAIEDGDTLPELQWIGGHLEFQLGQFEAALDSYQKVLAQQPEHRASIPAFFLTVNEINSLPFRDLAGVL